MHIAIAGNIGSGKTTLTTLLAKHYRYAPHFEQVDDNPYLNDFYKDMQRWSFNLQVFFLRSRFAQLAELDDLVGGAGLDGLGFSFLFQSVEGARIFFQFNKFLLVE